jgi:putative endonuclease
MKDTPRTQDIGQLAEQQACRYLEAQGLQLLVRNYRCKQGEIDLIMRGKNEIVFVEVRSRHHADYGSAIESIDQYKQQKLMRAAHHYLLQKKWFDNVNCRFDIIAINPTQPEPTIEWLEDAFSLDYL